MAGANIGGVGVLILPAEGLWRLCVAGNCVISDCGTVTYTGKAGIRFGSAEPAKTKSHLQGGGLTCGCARRNLVAPTGLEPVTERV